MTRCLLTVLTCCLLAAPAVARDDDDFATIARLAAEWFDASALDSPEGNRRERELEDELEPLIIPYLGDDLSDEAVMALFREAFELHKPAYVATLDAWLAQREGNETTGRVETMISALELYRMTHGAYPNAEQGLTVLLEDELIYAPHLMDGWGRSFRYRPGDDTYELRSAGPDGAFATDDDILANPEGIIAKAQTPASDPHPDSTLRVERDSALTIAVTGTVPPGVTPEDVWLGPDGRVAFRALVPEGQCIGFDGTVGPVFDRVWQPGFSDAGNAVAYEAERGPETILVAGDVELRVDPIFGGWVGLEDTDEFIIKDHDANGFFALFRGERLDVEIFTDSIFTDDRSSFRALRLRGKDGWYMHLRDETLGPFEWVSRPRWIEDTVVWRTWSQADGATLYLEADALLDADWIREPVTRNSRVAVTLAEGGRPGSLFRYERDRYGDEYGFGNESDPAPAYTDAVWRVVTDFESEHRFAYAGNVVFAPTTDGMAYTAQDSDGRWFIVRDEVPGPKFDDVTRPMWDDSGTRLAYTAKTGDTTVLMIDDERSPAFDAVILQESGGVFLSEAKSGDTTMLLADTTVLGSFDRLSFRDVDGTPYAVGWRGEKVYVSFGDTPTGPWIETATPTASSDGAAIAYGVRDAEGTRMVVNDRAGIAFDAIAAPTFLTDGRLAYIGVRRSASEADVYHVVVGTNVGPEHASIGGFAVGADGGYAYLAYEGPDDERCRIYVNGVPGPEFTTAPSAFGLLADGTLIYDFVTEDGDGHVVIGDDVSPHYDDLGWWHEPAADGTWCYRYSVDGGEGYATQAGIGPAFESADALSRTPDGQTIAYRGERNGQSFVAVGAWTSPPFDAVSEPKFTGDTVRFAARRGPELLHVTIDASALPSGTASARE